MTTPALRWAILAALALFAGGCLLPQPDTPPIPPGSMGAPTQEGAMPGAAPQAPGQDMGGQPLSPAAGSGASIVAKARLQAKVEGPDGTALVLRSAADPASMQRLAVGADGTLDAEVTAGEYMLEIAVGDRIYQAPDKLTLAPGETRAITVHVKGDRITIEDQARLVSPSPSPTPAP